MRQLAGDRIVGLDLGTANIRAIVAEMDGQGTAEIIGVGQSLSRGIVDGVVIDIADASQCMAGALDQARISSGTEIHQVVIGVSGRHFASLNSRGTAAITRTSRQISRDDLFRARDQARIIVLPPDREIIHCIPRFYRVDGQEGVRSPIGMFGSRLEMEAHLVTGAATHVQNAIQALRLAGYSTRAVVLAGIAAAESVLSPIERRSGSVSINIGAGTTDLCIFLGDNIVYSSVLNFGGASLTGDIADLLQLTFEAAEQVKKSLESALPPGDKDNKQRIVDCRVDELIHLVRCEIIKSGYYKLLPSGVIISGGGSRLSGLVESFKAALDVPVRLGETISSVKIPNESVQTEYATAVGLALYTSTNREKIFSFRSGGYLKFVKSVEQIMRRVRSLFN
jgi:cell division protein FtsA